MAEKHAEDPAWPAEPVRRLVAAELVWPGEDPPDEARVALQKAAALRAAVDCTARLSQAARVAAVAHAEASRPVQERLVARAATKPAQRFWAGWPSVAASEAARDAACGGGPDRLEDSPPQCRCTRERDNTPQPAAARVPERRLPLLEPPAPAISLHRSEWRAAAALVEPPVEA